MGEYFRNATTKQFEPYFDISEKNASSGSLKVIVSQSVIGEMINNASFDIGKVTILVSNEFAVTTIALSLSDGKMYPISGFPRALLATGGPRSNSAYHCYGGQRKLTISSDRVLYIS